MTGTKASDQAGGAADLIQQILGQSPGANVVGAAQPVFQRNLNDAVQNLFQFGGPRFASQTGRQAGELQQKALGDFNLFQQQVIENAMTRNLGALQSILGGAAGFAGQNQAAGGNVLQQLLDAAFKGGGVTTPPQFYQTPGTLGQISGVLGSLAPLAALLIPGAGPMVAAGMGAAGAMKPKATLGGSSFPAFGSSIGPSMTNPRNF